MQIAPEVTDRSLLERFVRRREEAAFAALVERHGPRVLGVCRRILHDEHDAEDAFQATFVVLARKAVVLPWEDSIHNWLNAVAARLACKARTQRRGVRLLNEDDLPDLPDPHAGPFAETTRRELRRLLDGEMDRLPEKYRAPMVLCYLEGKTNEEAARELGWPAGSMSRRLARARALLRHRLTGRGLILATVVMVVIGALWAFTGNRAADVVVREQMARFQVPREGTLGIEETLGALADENASSAQSERLAQLAGTAIEVAERIERHDPGRDRQLWTAYTEQMRGSAVQLASAARVQDREATFAAARRLHATCNQCHAAFR